ncbi:hypothetical protein [Actibacterium sp. 188UL27-1]|uniref:hypothetical protein n=1 Tax=Actibacterium sp. 188UL27-1 TaxID=2786961 RepID=UPI00195ABE40|nr:hypothetical protein [Actibacterium sp. 188UL27-1]MBM7067444.1 hypothetical protein [Actibacterium sp. 188UL27-1]
MTRLRMLLLAVLIGVGFSVSATDSAQAQGLNMLVMGEDADEDSVARGNRIFNRVILALGEEMNVRGFNVFDETAVALNITQPNRVRRRDAELIDVSRAVQNPPLDVVVVFQIYASARDSSYSDVVRPAVRIPGRMLNVKTGQMIGSFEVSGLELPPLPVDCERECLLETVGDNARVLATELADALAVKLEGFVGTPGEPALTVVAPSGTGDTGASSGAVGTECGGLPTAYVIKMDGFDTTEITALEEYMNAYSCVQSARPVRASSRSAEYWYETRSDSARLNRNLRLTLEHMGVTGQVQFSGNTFVISKIATR